MGVTRRGTEKELHRNGGLEQARERVGKARYYLDDV